MKRSRSLLTPALVVACAAFTVSLAVSAQAQSGGESNDCGAEGTSGTFFQLTPAGALTTVAVFEKGDSRS